MTPTELAERIEREGASRELLLKAFGVVFPIPPIESGNGCGGDCPLCGYEDRRQRFVAMIDAEAWLSAAEMLVPEGWASVALFRHDDGTWTACLAGNDGHMMAEDPDEFFVEVEYLPTPAAALCAAALRAGDTGHG